MSTRSTKGREAVAGLNASCLLFSPLLLSSVSPTALCPTRPIHCLSPGCKKARKQLFEQHRLMIPLSGPPSHVLAAMAIVSIQLHVNHVRSRLLRGLSLPLLLLIASRSTSSCMAAAGVWIAISWPRTGHTHTGIETTLPVVH